MQLHPQQVHAFILALYNLDVFRQAIQAPGFSEKFAIPEARYQAALTGDEALLELGQAWRAVRLFG